MIKVVLRGDFTEFTKKKLSTNEINYGINWINNYRNKYSAWEDTMSDEMDDFHDWITKDSESIFIFDKDAIDNSNPLFGVKVYDETGTLIEELDFSEVGLIRKELGIWKGISASEALSSSLVSDYKLGFVLNTDRFDSNKLKIIQDKDFIFPESSYASLIVYDDELIPLADNTDSFPKDSFDEMHPCKNLEFLGGFLICDNDNNYHFTYECGGLEHFFEDIDDNSSETKKTVNNRPLLDQKSIVQQKETVCKDNKHILPFLGAYQWKTVNEIILLSPEGIFPEIPKKYNYRREDIFEYEKDNQTAYFEIQKDFLNGVFYNLEQNFSSYAFILMFDVLTSFKDNKNIPAFANQCAVLVKCCSTLSKYINGEVKELVWPYIHDDLQKIELLEHLHGLEEYLSIYDYAKYILRYDEHKIECLHIFDKGYVSISSVMLCKSKQKRFKVTNPQIAKVFCDVVLYVLNKYDDFNSVLEDSLRLYFFKKNGRLTKREKDKIKMTPSRLSDDNWLTLLCFNRIVISVYKQLRISDTRCDSDIKHPYGWEGFSIVNFDEFLKEAIEKYIGCCK